jgi:hypothetical protein
MRREVIYAYHESSMLASGWGRAWVVMACDSRGAGVEVIEREGSPHEGPPFLRR